MVILEFLASTALGVFIGLWVGNQGQKQQQQRNLDQAFYRLVAAQNGKISLIQLAAAAQVSAELAQHYLEQQVQVFSAFPEVDEDANTYYRFPKLKLPQMLNGPDW